MSVISLLGICVISAVLAVLFKQYKGEYAILVSVIAGVAVFATCLWGIARSVGEVKDTINQMGLDTSYFSVAMKSLGICVITGFVADLCREAGQVSLATRAELVGRCAIFVLSMPLLVSLIETAYKFIG